MEVSWIFADKRHQSLFRSFNVLSKQAVTFFVIMAVVVVGIV